MRCRFTDVFNIFLSVPSILVTVRTICRLFVVWIFLNRIYPRKACSRISRYITRNVHKGFVKRVRSPWISFLSPSFSVSSISPFHFDVSPELSRKNFYSSTAPVENYGSNEILSRRRFLFYVVLGFFFIAVSQSLFGSDGYFATRC